MLRFENTGGIFAKLKNRGKITISIQIKGRNTRAQNLKQCRQKFLALTCNISIAFLIFDKTRSLINYSGSITYAT
jgi:hypothetical protein